MPSYVKNRTLIDCYSENFPPLDTAEIQSVKQGILLDDDSDSDTDSDASSELSEPPLDDCEPPITRASRGRPSKKRKRNGENDGRRKKGRNLNQAVQRAPLRCSTCRGVGHNARNCTRSHT
jgi:hypothetical protein